MSTETTPARVKVALVVLLICSTLCSFGVGFYIHQPTIVYLDTILVENVPVQNITINPDTPMFLMHIVGGYVNESVWNGSWYNAIINDKPSPPDYQNDSFICSFYFNGKYLIEPDQDRVKFTVNYTKHLFESFEIDAVKIDGYNATEHFTTYSFGNNGTAESIDWMTLTFFGHGSLVPLIEDYLLSPYLIVHAQWHTDNTLEVFP